MNDLPLPKAGMSWDKPMIMAQWKNGMSPKKVPGATFTEYNGGNLKLLKLKHGFSEREGSLFEDYVQRIKDYFPIQNHHLGSFCCFAPLFKVCSLILMMMMMMMMMMMLTYLYRGCICDGSTCDGCSFSYHGGWYRDFHQSWSHHWGLRTTPRHSPRASKADDRLS